MSSDPIGLWLAASIASGVTGHVALTARTRRSYDRLRDAYTGAVADAQQSGDAAAIVRAQELHREFVRTTQPGWLTGLAARLKAALVLCSLVGVAVMVAAGDLSPIFAGVAVLFAIVLRRLLFAAALVLALFAATSVLSPRPADRAPAAHLSAPAHTGKAPVRSQ